MCLRIKKKKKSVTVTKKKKKSPTLSYVNTYYLSILHIMKLGAREIK